MTERVMQSVEEEQRLLFEAAMAPMGSSTHHDGATEPDAEQLRIFVANEVSALYAGLQNFAQLEAKIAGALEQSR